MGITIVLIEDAAAARHVSEAVRGAVAAAARATPIVPALALPHHEPIARLATAPIHRAVATAIFQRQGEYWTIVNRGVPRLYRHMKGFQLLAHLLADPQRRFHATELLAEADGVAASASERTISLADDDLSIASTGGSVGSGADANVHRAYRAQLGALREQLADARRCNDGAKAARLHETIAVVADELTIRGRAIAPALNRARLAVRKNITAALKKMRPAHAHLAYHLATHVKTGYTCVYLPDPEAPIQWTL